MQKDGISNDSNRAQSRRQFIKNASFTGIALAGAPIVSSKVSAGSDDIEYFQYTLDDGGSGWLGSYEVDTYENTMKALAEGYSVVTTSAWAELYAPTGEDLLDSDSDVKVKTKYHIDGTIGGDGKISVELFVRDSDEDTYPIRDTIDSWSSTGLHSNTRNATVQGHLEANTSYDFGLKLKVVGNDGVTTTSGEHGLKAKYLDEGPKYANVKIEIS